MDHLREAGTDTLSMPIGSGTRYCSFLLAFTLFHRLVLAYFRRGCRVTRPLHIRWCRDEVLLCAVTGPAQIAR